jgi:hypothetical protein
MALGADLEDDPRGVERIDDAPVRGVTSLVPRTVTDQEAPSATGLASGDGQSPP